MYPAQVMAAVHVFDAFSQASSQLVQSCGLWVNIEPRSTKYWMNQPHPKVHFFYDERKESLKVRGLFKMPNCAQSIRCCECRTGQVVTSPGLVNTLLFLFIFHPPSEENSHNSSSWCGEYRNLCCYLLRCISSTDTPTLACSQCMAYRV